MDHQPASPNYFSTYRIDRVAERRRDEAWLAAQLEAQTTRFIPVWKTLNLLTAGEPPRPVWLAPDQARALLPVAETIILLGVQGGITYFALDLPGEGETPPGPLAELGRFRELRQAAPLLEAGDGALLAYARAMTYWHCRHRFCGRCGSRTRSAEAGCLRLCTNDACRQHHFPRTDPAIIVLVTRGERCLLGHKPEWPPGMYSNVAGFVEPGESLEDAVRREVDEETGVEVLAASYHSSQPWPFPSALMVGFTALATGETLRPDAEEFESVCWFSRADISDKLRQGALRLPSPISVSFRLIEDWFDAGDLGRLREIVK